MCNYGCEKMAKFINFDLLCLHMFKMGKYGQIFMRIIERKYDEKY